MSMSSDAFLQHEQKRVDELLELLHIHTCIGTQNGCMCLSITEELSEMGIES